MKLRGDLRSADLIVELDSPGSTLSTIGFESIGRWFESEEQEFWHDTPLGTDTAGLGISNHDTSNCMIWATLTKICGGNMYSFDRFRDLASIFFSSAHTCRQKVG